MTNEREPIQQQQPEGVIVPRTRIEAIPTLPVAAGIYAAIARGQEARDQRQASTE